MRLPLVFLVLAGIALASVALYVQVSAQEERQGAYAHIYAATQPGDDDVVATIGKQPITRGQIRQAEQLHQTLGNPSGIGLLVQDFIRYEAAIQAGYLVPDDEVQAHMDTMRAFCDGPDGTDCQALIQATGLTDDEYWTMAFDEYRRALTVTAMQAAHVVKLYPDGEYTAEELDAALASLDTTLQADVDIKWSDDDLRGAFQDGVVSR